MSLREKLVSHVQVDDKGCWIWQRSLSKGYGQVSVNGHIRRVHRVMYELEFGPIPEGLDVHHTCNVPRCCNPAHLRAVTRAENQSFGPNATKTHCKNGHPFDVANTRIAPDGHRVCRTCAAANVRRFHQRRGT